MARETAAVVALLRSRAVRWTEAAAEIEDAGGAEAALERALPAQGSLLPGPDLAAIAMEVEAWEGEGMRLLTVLDDEYPANLRGVYNRPPLLFIAGEMAVKDQRSIAVVGSRKASSDGLKQAETVAKHAVRQDYTVVSGLAAGVDAAAHRATLGAGSRTVAVIGTGLRRRYPAENAALQEEIAQRGAVVSQFWPDQPPTKTSFPMRNAVMSGLALATVVIEAGERSGARMQARLAREHGRPVFLMSALREHVWARDAAEHPGTQFVDDPEEIFEYLSLLAHPERAFA